MPNITSSGTYDKDSTGFAILGSVLSSSDKRLLLFSGTSIGTQCTIEVQDDQGNWDDVTNGTITSLPSDALISTRNPIRLVFTGSPNCNVSLEYYKVS